MKKRSLLLVLLLMAAVVMVACSGTTQDVIDDLEDTASDLEDTAEDVAEDVEEAADDMTEEEEPMEEDMGYEFPTSVGADCEESGSLIESITVVDEMTVEFSLCQPDPSFLEKAAFAAFHIQPAEHYVNTGGSGDLLENPIGTGPYAIQSWNRGDSIVYTAYRDYWNEAEYADRAETLVFRWSTEGAARLNELLAGQVDGIDNPSPSDFDTIRENSDLSMQDREGLNILYLAMTNTFEPFDNVDVRQAVAMGIDRQRIVDNFYPAGSEVASHFTPCAIANGCQGEEWYEFDAEAARAALADAGYPDGFETSIYYRDVFRSYLPEPGQVAVELQTQLRENLGIEAEVVVMESGEFIAESTAGNLDGFYLLGWGADYPHVTNFLDFHFSSNNPQFGDPHPGIYELLNEGAQIPIPSDAAGIYEDANNAIKNLVPMVPVAHGGSGVAYRADVDGAFASPLGNEWFAAMNPGGRDTFVWMQNAEPISLFCGDETDGESLRACEQVTEGLYAYAVGGTLPEPALATECVANDDLTVWTCTLREGVTFHDGSTLDATDVLMSWAVPWDFSNEFHVGNTGAFEYMDYLWGGINKPDEE